MINPSLFTPFKTPPTHIRLPAAFTFPYYYDPHPLALLATKELQFRIQNEINWTHDFGLEEKISALAMGKMFGVLVIKNTQGELGYLSAFSGKLENNNLENIFVPSISSQSGKGDHLAFELEKIDKLSAQVQQLAKEPNFIATKETLEQRKREYTEKVLKEKGIIQKERTARKLARNKFKLTLTEDAYQILHHDHIQISNNDKFFLKHYAEYLNEKLEKYQSAFDLLNNRITDLRSQRKLISIELQNWLLAQYNFLNSKGETKNVVDIFKETTPPSGAGDCAAPRLIQYAFLHGYEPIALAEFWWGKELQSKVRKHKNFYPACRGKCKPILDFMLEGIKVAPNPLLVNPAVGKRVETVYEDEHLLVINKPTEFLSVPGKDIKDSVQERMLKKYPNATGSMIVHRLDMSTSGLMIIAKTKQVHKDLQQQFIKKKVTKRYMALLDGVLENDVGQIDLPLRTDIDNRPFQMVCYEHGKPSTTRYEVIERNATTTKVYFYPLSGRTHQLRVHAAHHDGLGTAIIGDDLYGVKKDFLHLHAERIAFEHPITKIMVELDVAAAF